MSYNINETFIIQTVDNAEPTFTACTGVYSNAILSCSGNTSILLSSSTVSVIGDIFTNNNLNANNITASNYFSGSTQLSDIIDSNSLTGGTYNGQTLSLGLKNGSNISISGFTDIFVTGGTYSNGSITLINNSGGTFTINGLFTGNTDVFVTGGTYNSNTGIATFTNNTGGTFTLSGFSTSTQFTGGTVTGSTNFTGGITANTISATTYQNLPLDVFVTGGTYSNGNILFTNNTGGTFNVTGLFTGNTDVFVTGGTYSAGTAIFTNNTGGTFSITGFSTSTGVDVFVTGSTYHNNTFTFTNNTGGTFNVLFNTLTGLTINGDLSVTGISHFNTVTATSVSNINYLGFNTSYTGTPSFGQMSWNTDFGVPQVTMVGGNVIQKIGETVFSYVKNVDSVTLNKGDVVYIFGASGDKLSVKRASNTGDTTSSKTLGVVAETIAINGLGYVITQGTLDGLNLGSYTAGDIVWLDSTPGSFTKTKQYAPYHLVFIGVVQRANAGNGQLYVKPQNGYELEELHDVIATGATYGDLLVYSAYNGYDVWVNTKTLNGSYTITGNTTIGGTLSATTLNVTSTSNLNGPIVSNNLSGSTNRIVEVTSGGTLFATKQIISAYLQSGSTIANLLDNYNNWDINGVYTGVTITGTSQGQKHYNNNYFFEAVDDNLWIRLIRG